MSVAGLPNDKLPAGGQAFVKAFAKTIGGKQADPYTIYAAQAAEVIVSAVAASDGTRAGVAAQLFKTQIKNGILGTFGFNKNGDVTANPVTIYEVVSGASKTLKVIVPDNTLVAAA